MSASVAIIVLNYRNAKDTIECLNSLVRLQGIEGRIIVVDNGSNDGSVEQIKNWAQGRILVRHTKITALSGDLSAEQAKIFSSSIDKRVVLIETEENLGYAGGNNIGIRYALHLGFSLVWVLNNDVIVKPDSLEQMLRVLQKDSKLGLVGATIRYLKDPEKIQTAGGGYVNPWIGVTNHFLEKFNEPGQQFPYVSGACFLARREMFEDIGLLDEDYFLYWEDTDLSMRALEKGWKLGWASEAVVYHGVGHTAGIRSRVSEFHHARSGVLFFWKHRRMFGGWMIGVFVFFKIARRVLVMDSQIGVCWKGIKDGMEFILRTPSSKGVL